MEIGYLPSWGQGTVEMGAVGGSTRRFAYRLLESGGWGIKQGGRGNSWVSSLGDGVLSLIELETLG